MSYEIPKGCCATYYPESNPLVPLQHVAKGSNQPASKSVIVSLSPAGKSKEFYNADGLAVASS